MTLSGQGKLRGREMPGDDLLAHARWQRTHAITIDAELSQVWRMLLHVLHAARVSGHQTLCVLRFEPERSFVLGSPCLLAGEGIGDARAWRASWAFALEPAGRSMTRVRVRLRADYDPSATVAAACALLAPVYELMERRQLRMLKRRVEAQAPKRALEVRVYDGRARKHLLPVR
jgi:hypothetical protein